MRHPLISILLCALATAAGASEVAGSAGAPSKSTPTTVPAAATAAKSGSTPKAELISTAAAAVHDPETVRAPRASAISSESDAHDGGLAMLLTAIAVMAAIALRRLGSRER